MLSSLSRNKILLAIFALGIFLRLLGTNPGLLAHGDEVMYGEAIKMILNSHLKTQILGYPPFIPWLMLISFKGFFIPLAWLLYIPFHLTEYTNAVLRGFVAQSFAVNILKPNWLNALLWGRYLTAFFGSLIIILAYKVSKLYFNSSRIGIISAFFVAVNYRLVLNSMIGFPDIYNAFFLLLSIWVTGRLFEDASVKGYVIAWIFVAFSFLVKYQVYAFFPLFMVHLLVTFKNYKGGINKIVQLFRIEMVIGGLIALFMVVVSHGYHFINLEKVYEINQYEALKYAFGRNILNVFPISYTYHHGIGPILSFIAIIGVLICFFDSTKRRQAFILLSPFPLYFFLYFYYTSGGFFTRNLLAMYPIILIFAGVAVVTLVNLVNKKLSLSKNMAAALLLSVTLLVSSSNINNSFVASFNFTRKSPHFKVFNWVRRNISGDITYATYNARFVPADLAVKVVKLTHPQAALSYSELVDEGFDVVLLDFIIIQGEFVWWMSQAPRIGLKFWKQPYDLLSQNYEALAIRELLYRDNLFATSTPWQAPRYNYAVISLDRNEVEIGKKIEEYDFNKDAGWTKLYYLPEFFGNLKHSQEGNKSSGSLSIKGSNIQGSSRWESRHILIKEGRQYTARGWIRNSKDVAKQVRNGFIRLDFHSDISTNDILSRPIISYVSPRTFGEVGWHEAIVTGVAPEGAKYMVVGFQSDYADGTEYLLDDVEIFESSSRIDQVNEPFIINDQNFFHPNNRGFL